MPQAKPKPSDIAAEAKRVFFVQAEKRCPNLPAKSILYPDTSRLSIRPGTVTKRKLRVAVIDGDPLDVALDWHDHNQRSGNHSVQQFKNLPVISVAPIRRPKLDETGADYSFDQEKDMMKEKMRSVLRIAAHHHRFDLCMGAFGVGPGFRNPAAQVASMWRDLLFDEAEFHGVFSNVVFAIENTTDNTSKDGLTDHDVFKKEFDPSNIVKTSFRQSVEGK
ncbi:MAG: hypothetical protein Q9201_002900 [Fulgogasparrea decipioides]